MSRGGAGAGPRQRGSRRPPPRPARRRASTSRSPEAARGARPLTAPLTETARAPRGGGRLPARRQALRPRTAPGAAHAGAGGEAAGRRPPGPEPVPCQPGSAPSCPGPARLPGQLALRHLSLTADTSCLREGLLHTGEPRRALGVAACRQRGRRTDQGAAQRRWLAGWQHLYGAAGWLSPLAPSIECPFHIFLQKEGDGWPSARWEESGRELLEEKHVSPAWWLSNLALPTSCQRVDGATPRDMRAFSDGRKHWVKQQLATKQGGTRQ